MRVKKLNANRRPKAGEDDAVTGASSDSYEQSSPSNWASPTKEPYSPASDDNNFRRVEVVDLGADSPTDPSAAPSVHSHEVSELDLNRHYLSSLGSMANVAATKNASSGPAASAGARNDANSSWRDRVDRALRESVHQKIVEYLRTLKPNAPSKVLEKLPGLAYRMEEGLFKLATSETEYSDQTTLPQRLTLIQQANARRLLQQQCPAVSPKDKDAAGRTASHPRQPLNEEQARVVFSCLQSWRQKLVNMYGATPWDILPNRILAKVAVFIPSSTQELVVCGVSSEQLERFGNSLLQEIEKIMNALNANASAVAAAQQMQASINASRSVSPLTSKRPSPSGGKSNGQSSTKARDQVANKKRKTGADASSASTASAVRLAAAPTAFAPQTSFIAPSPTLIRPMDPAFIAAATSAAAAAASLPALLSSANAAANAKKTSAFIGAGATPPFFPRIPVPGSTLDQDNRMHLLAQGVGQLSKQQEQQQQQLDQDKEIQALRWMLQESQREKAQLEAEVQRLRQQGTQ